MKTKYIILFGILLILFYVSFNFWQKSNRRSTVDESKNNTLLMSNEEMRLEKIHLVEEKHGQKTWELEATQINQYQGQDLLILKDVKAKLFLKDGKTLNVSGMEGKFYQDSKNIELSGDVLLKSTDGYSLRTHSLFFDHSKKRVSSKDLVEIEDGRIKITGIGMVIDIEAKILKLLSQVKTFWKGEDR